MWLYFGLFAPSMKTPKLNTPKNHMHQNECLPKWQDLNKINRKYHFSRTPEKENPWSEDEMDTGTTTEANEPIEVDDDVSHETSENKEQGKFQSCWASLYT
jgi:hypothetical protein